jgi:cell division protein FtsL
MALGWRDRYVKYKEYYLNIQVLYKQRADLRAFLEIMLSMATIIIFLVFALKPTALTIISLYNEIQEKQKTVALLDQKISALATARRLMDQNQSSIANIDASVTDSPRPDLLVQQIQALAVKNSVTVLGISVGQVSLMGAVQTAQTSAVVPLPGNAGQMEVSVSVRGDYPNLITLLNDIKNLRMVTKVDSTGINSSESDQGRIIVAVVSGRAPYIGQ